MGKISSLELTHLNLLDVECKIDILGGPLASTNRAMDVRGIVRDGGDFCTIAVPGWRAGWSATCADDEKRR
jgi:hypothetical protein